MFKRLPLTFSLRSLLILMLLVALGIGTAVRVKNEGQRQKQIVDRLKGMGGKVTYDYQVHSNSNWYALQRKYAQRLGPDVVGHVTELDLTRVQDESILRDYGLEEAGSLRG